MDKLISSWVRPRKNGRAGNPVKRVQNFPETRKVDTQFSADAQYARTIKSSVSAMLSSFLDIPDISPISVDQSLLLPIKVDGEDATILSKPLRKATDTTLDPFNTKGHGNRSAGSQKVPLRPNNNLKKSSQLNRLPSGSGIKPSQNDSPKKSSRPLNIKSRIHPSLKKNPLELSNSQNERARSNRDLPSHPSKVPLKIPSKVVPTRSHNHIDSRNSNRTNLAPTNPSYPSSQTGTQRVRNSYDGFPTNCAKANPRLPPGSNMVSSKRPRSPSRPAVRVPEPLIRSQGPIMKPRPMVAGKRPPSHRPEVFDSHHPTGSRPGGFRSGFTEVEQKRHHHHQAHSYHSLSSQRTVASSISSTTTPPDLQEEDFRRSFKQVRWH